MKKYRVKIQEIIENSHSHLTAEEVFRLLRETFPQVVRATVYNNLNALCEAASFAKFLCKVCPTDTTASEGTTTLYAKRADAL